MAITSGTFQFIQKFVGARAGIALAERSAYLAEARLLPLARRQNVSTVEDLIDKVRAGNANGLEHEVLDALLPKDTSFFRDGHPFELLKEKILRLLEMSRFKERRLRIWSAGCAGCQEACSIAIILHRYFSQLLRWDVEIVATDLSREELAKAQTGRYDEIEVHRGVQPILIKEYFRQDGAYYFFRDDVGHLIRLEEFNLAGDWPELPAMDVVFMRNVLRYMSGAAQAQILGKLKRVLKPDGYLFLGAQESAAEIDRSYSMVPVEKSVYFQLSQTSKTL